MFASPRVKGGPLADWERLAGAQLRCKSLGRSAFFGQGQPRRQRGTFGTVHHAPTIQDKENYSFSTEEAYKLLERKAEEPSIPANSPTRLDNPLSLARFHDALALHRPPPEMRNVEVRTVHATPSASSPIQSRFRSALARVSPNCRPVEEKQSGSPGQSSLTGSPSPRRNARSGLPAHFFDGSGAESSSAALRRRAALDHSSRHDSLGCCGSKVQAAHPAEEKLLHRSLDGCGDISAVASDAEHALQAGLPNDEDNAKDLKRFNRHGPIRTNNETSFEEQKRAIIRRFARQAELFGRQLEGAQRFGRTLNMDSIFAGDDRVDEVDPLDFGPRDMHGKLKEWEALEAERLDKVEGQELADLAARVKDAEEQKSLLGSRRGERALGLAAVQGEWRDKMVFDVDRWQRTIQANHKELNEGKEKGKENEDEGDEKVKLDISMLDVVDSDETEGFSSEGSDEAQDTVE